MLRAVARGEKPNGYAATKARDDGHIIDVATGGAPRDWRLTDKGLAAYKAGAPSVITCVLCGRSLPTWQGLSRHVKSAHGLDAYAYHRDSPAAMAQLRSRIEENTEKVSPPEGYDVDGPCWRWKGRLTRGKFSRGGHQGYGSLRLSGSPTETAHRLSWWAHSSRALVEPPPTPDVVLMHQCDNSACVNPSHLVPGDHAANMAERKERGRHLDCHSSELSEADIHEIRLRAHGGESHRSIGEDYGLSKSAVCHICAGRSFGHIHTPLDIEPDPDHIPF